MATNRPRKKNVMQSRAQFACDRCGVILRTYTNAETENYQFNCRKYTDLCYYRRQLITQSLRKPNLCT